MKKKNLDPMRKGTRLYQAAAKARNDEFFASDEGRAAIERLRVANELSSQMQVKSMTFIGKPKKSIVDKGLSDLSQALVDKMMKR